MYDSLSKYVLHVAFLLFIHSNVPPSQFFSFFSIEAYWGLFLRTIPQHLVGILSFFLTLKMRLQFLIHEASLYLNFRILYSNLLSTSISPSKGFFRVWIHNATKHETSLVEIDCREKNYRVLDVIEYDGAARIKDRYGHYDNPAWLDISQKTVPEPLHSILCP